MLRSAARSARAGDRGALGRLSAGVARLRTAEALELLADAAGALPPRVWAEELLGALGVPFQARTVLRPVPCEAPAHEVELQLELHGASCGLSPRELDLVRGERAVAFTDPTPALLLELALDRERLDHDLSAVEDEAAWSAFEASCVGLDARWWSAADGSRGADLDAGPFVVRAVWREPEGADPTCPMGLCLSTVTHREAPDVPLLVRRFPGRVAHTAFDLRRAVGRLARAATEPASLAWMVQGVLGLGSLPGRITLRRHDDSTPGGPGHTLARAELAPDGGESSAWLGPWRACAADVVVDLVTAVRGHDGLRPREARWRSPPVVEVVGVLPQQPSSPSALQRWLESVEGARA